MPRDARGKNRKFKQRDDRNFDDINEEMMEGADKLQPKKKQEDSDEQEEN